MQMVEDIRNFIGEREDAWHAKGWVGETVPLDERRNFQQAEEIGLKLFEGIGIPADYWRNSEIELERTLQRIEDDADMQMAARNWPQMSREEQRIILQKAVTVMAEEQTKQAGMKIVPGTVGWVEGAAFEGNSSADYKDSPQDYKIELNSDKETLTEDFSSAIKCTLHEQIHVKQSNYAHAYRVSQLPSAFNDAARYFIRQPDAYVPPWRSDRLYEAQPCEREALMATRSARSLSPP